MKEENEYIKRSFKLDNLPKKQIYSVPDDYFTELPTIIQSKAIQSNKNHAPVLSWSNALRYALPVFALAMMLAYFGTRINNDDIDIQALLDDVPTEALVDYISESDITTEELLALIDINELDLDGMVEEDISLINDDEWDELIEEYSDLENEI